MKLIPTMQVVLIEDGEVAIINVADFDETVHRRLDDVPSLTETATHPTLAMKRRRTKGSGSPDV